jgi:hypothetical protein
MLPCARSVLRKSGLELPSCGGAVGRVTAPLVHVFGHLVTRRKNLANQIHELFVTINREFKLGLD